MTLQHHATAFTCEENASRKDAKIKKKLLSQLNAPCGEPQRVNIYVEKTSINFFFRNVLGFLARMII